MSNDILFGGYKGLFDSLENEQFNNVERKVSYLDSADRIVKLKTYNKDTGLTVSTDLRLAIVKPTVSYMPVEQDVSIFKNISQPGILYAQLKKLSGLVAVDLETNGTQAADPNVKIVGLGLASSDQIMYFDFKSNSPQANQVVLDFLVNYGEGLVAHNVMFDGAFLLRETGVWLDWRFDTYALGRQLANEGYPGFNYGLKFFQTALLGWPAKGDVKLDKWLIKNQHISDIKKMPQQGYYLGKPADDGTARYYKPRKSEMHLAPPEILGFYCGLDCASTFQLCTEVFLPSIEGQPWADTFLNYHACFMLNVEQLANQQLTGITIKKLELEEYGQLLKQEIEDAYRAFIEHPDVRPLVSEFNEQVLVELREREPTKFKKQKTLSKEPARYKKNGEESKVWVKWAERKQELETQEPELTSHWISWNNKMAEAEQSEHFNLNSSAHLQWLFYDKLNFPVEVTTPNGDPGTGVKALPGFGELGTLLKTNKDREKELGYVKSCLDHLFEDDEGNHRLHPQFRAPGTLTCRLAGSGGLNLQQIPKSRRYLELWGPKPGKAWIDCDHTSLEQVVLAELSRDTALWKIYGPGAKPNDIYLFNGAQLPVIGDAIREAGYDPDNPTPDAIAATKKACKKQRGISKVITLGSSYGMGADKLQMTLRLQGIDISLEEAKQMHGSYWNIYSGVKEYERFLLRQHKNNNGWVLNGVGRPVAVAKDYIKDIVNRVVQSTGHDVHMMYVECCTKLLAEANIDYDWIVVDFHDQSIIECNEKDKDLVYDIIGRQAYDLLNSEYLQGEIPLQGDPQHILTMADAKCE